MAYAASTLAKSEMNVAVTDTRIVFHSQSGYAVSNRSFLMCASVGFFTQNGLPSRDKSSSFGLNVVTIIQ